MLALSFVALIEPNIASAQQPDDGIPVVVVPCQDCVSLDDLQSTAINYFYQWKNRTPPGFDVGSYVRPCMETVYDPRTWEFDTRFYSTCTTALVVSVSNPISGPFTLASIDYGAVSVRAENLIDTLSALDFDNKVFARAMKGIVVELPDTYPDDLTLISSDISSRWIIQGGTQESSWWHFFTNLPSLELISFEFREVDANGQQTGRVVRIYIGGTITVRFANGWTAKYKLTNPLSTIQWTYVEGSLRDENGNDPREAPATQRQDGAATVIQNPLTIPSGATMLIPYIDRRGFVYVLPLVPSGGGNGDVFQPFVIKIK